MNTSSCANCILYCPSVQREDITTCTEASWASRMFLYKSSAAFFVQKFLCPKKSYSYNRYISFHQYFMRRKFTVSSSFEPTSELSLFDRWPSISRRAFRFRYNFKFPLITTVTGWSTLNKLRAKEITVSRSQNDVTFLARCRYPYPTYHW